MDKDNSIEPKGKYDWLLDMKESEFRAALRQYESDLLLVYDKCGPVVLFALWEHLHGIPVYPSKKALYVMAAQYVRKNYNPKDSAYSKKQMAAELGVSLRFVELALETTDKNDPRNLDLFAKEGA